MDIKNPLVYDGEGVDTDLRTPILIGIGNINQPHANINTGK